MNPERTNTKAAAQAAQSSDLTLAVIAATYGISKATLRRALRRRGIKPRAAGRPRKLPTTGRME